MVDKRNNTAALFGHFRDVERREGNAVGMIAMHLFAHGWFWVIPLPDGITSVGVVGTVPQSFNGLAAQIGGTRRPRPNAYFDLDVSGISCANSSSATL